MFSYVKYIKYRKFRGCIPNRVNANNTHRESEVLHMKRTHGLDEREMELVKLLMVDCQTTGDIQAKLKRLFAGAIEQMLEAEMDEHFG